jgi:hypothetical protein
MTAEVHPLQGLKDQYDQLLAKLAAIYARIQPLEDQLTKANADVIAAQVVQMELADRIDEILRETELLKLKKHIRQLAKALGEPGGLLAKKD